MAAITATVLHAAVIVDGLVVLSRLLMVPTAIRVLRGSVGETEYNLQLAQAFVGTMADLVLLLATFAALLTWMFWVHQALTQRGHLLGCSRWSCVYYWFVPVQQLYFPWKAMRELWRASHLPEPVSDTLVTAWWLLVLLSFAGELTVLGKSLILPGQALWLGCVLPVLIAVLAWGSTIALLGIVLRVNGRLLKERTAGATADE